MRAASSRVVPDAETFNRALVACRAKWAQSAWLLQEMRHERLQANPLSYRCAICGCHGDQWWRALALLEEMREEGVRPTATCYSLAIATCGRPQWRTALALLADMQE